MIKRLTPQEKKALSYQKDCRNTYDENDKSSREAIRRNKTYSIRKERRKLNAAVKEDLKGTGYALTPRRNIQAWKKVSDTPLAKIIPRTLENRQTVKYNAKAKRRGKLVRLSVKLIDNSPIT